MASRPISPAEPPKKHPPPIQPNAHPYAIKTTSSALLSRSNSSPHSPHTKHHYVPSSLSSIPTGARVRHRHSSSLPSVEAGVPTSLPPPLPPPVTVASSDRPSMSPNPDGPKLTQRTRRADTMPSSSATDASRSDSQRHGCSHDQDSEPELYADLPPDPKEWDTDELTTYLERFLQLSNNADRNKEDTILLEIVECVHARGLTGRELLRLTDVDLTDAPLSDVQRAQLLECSRTLRASVLRGRIYVDSYHSREISDNSNDIYSRSARSSTPFHSIRGASVSVDDLRLLLDNNSSIGTLLPSPTVPLHRSNSVSDAAAARYRDLARMRMRRRGKVKGLVETWERASTSESECSAGDEESMSEPESETDPEFEPISDAKHPSEPPTNLPSVLHDEPPHDTRPSITNPTAVLQELPSSAPPPPYTRMRTTSTIVGDEEEEPSIEELMASSSDIPLRGARAWEADFCLGETVKRIPLSLSADAGGTSPLASESDMSHPKNGDGQPRRSSQGSVTRANTGSRRKNARTQKRVVTAIFTGASSNNISKTNRGETGLDDQSYHASGTDSIIHNKASSGLDPQDDSDSVLQVLEASIAATQAQMESFKLRLEEVEAETARREVELEQTRHSDSRHSSKPPLRRRQLVVEERAMRDTPELLRENEDFVNREVPDNLETMSTGNIVRVIVARAMRWMFPYGHAGTSARQVRKQSQARTDSLPGGNNIHPVVTKSGRFSIARMSCSIILVSFAVCAAALRRLGFGRWARRP